MTLKINLSFGRKKKLVLIYICVTLNLYIYMEEMNIFIALNHPLQERMMSFHLLSCICVPFRGHLVYYSFLTFIFNIFVEV